MDLTGIILTGGKSKRFYKDTGILKQFANFRGKPLLYYPINSFLKLCNQIIISIHMDTDEKKINSIINKYFFKDKNRINIIYDDQNLITKKYGPVDGIISSVNKLTTICCIVSPADTPLMNDIIYIELIKGLQEGHNLVSFINKDGFITSLNYAIRIESDMVDKLLQLINMKIELKLNVRVSDIFLNTKNIKLIRYKSQYSHPFQNINSKNDMKNIIQMNINTDEIVDGSVIIQNKYDIIELFNTKISDIFKYNILKKYDEWIGTMVHRQLMSDINKL